MALALLRSGASETAADILNDLSREGSLDEETLGLKARIHKDLWQKAADRSERRKQVKLAYRAYEEAYKLTGGYWTGINAATMALIQGSEDVAVELAREAKKLCLEDLEGQKEGNTYWPLATLGEAALILREWNEAEDWYSKAAEAGKGRFGDLSSTRRNARLLIQFLGVDGKRIEDCFKVPPVIFFSGHMIDHPDRLEPRFPASLEGAVKDEIVSRFDRIGGQIVYSSAACGADILFLEEALRRACEVHVILPFESEAFVRESVDTVPGSDWVERYSEVCAGATEIVLASPTRIVGGGTAFEYANLILMGLASIKAQQLDSELFLMTVWDGKRGDGPGGTSSMVERCLKLGWEVEWIQLEESGGVSTGVQIRGTTLHPPQDGPETNKGEGPEVDIKALLFGDVVHFSKLTEEEIPRFVQVFLRRIADLISSSKHAPTIRNTWGDGLFFVFDSVKDAGLFSLELKDLMEETSWTSEGFRSELGLRIGLHVGPVYRFFDPVAGRNTCFGSHVSRTARIEPITPPGKVYASQAFAALASSETDVGFQCDYVGLTPLPKDAGTFPTYHVHRNGS